MHITHTHTHTHRHTRTPLTHLHTYIPHHPDTHTNTHTETHRDTTHMYTHILINTPHIYTDAHTTQKHIPLACINNCTCHINMHAHTKIYTHTPISVNRDTQIHTSHEHTYSCSINALIHSPVHANSHIRAYAYHPQIHTCSYAHIHTLLPNGSLMKSRNHLVNGRETRMASMGKDSGAPLLERGRTRLESLEKQTPPAHSV